MEVNKVEYFGKVLLDLTEDSVTPETLAEGVTAHDKSGAVITGTMKASVEDLEAVLAEQEALIATLQETLKGKASGGGSSETEVLLLTREITEYSNPTLTTLGAYALSGTNIVSLNLPALTTIAGYAFYQCTKLTEVNFPLLTEVPNNGFREFTGVVKADFASITKAGSNCFYKCTSLETLIIRASSVVTLASGTTFTATPIASGTGYIYVPSALVDAYKTATNWSAFANQFRAIEDYPDICGGEA